MKQNTNHSDQNWNKMPTMVTKTVISLKEGPNLIMGGNHKDQKCNLLYNLIENGNNQDLCGWTAECIKGHAYGT